MEFAKIPENYRKDIEDAVALLKNEGCEAIYLFGSLVTGKVHQNSDIDIGIKGYPKGMFFKIYSKIEHEISRIDKLLDEASPLLGLCHLKIPDFIEISAPAQILHSFYNGVESKVLTGSHRN